MSKAAESIIFSNKTIKPVNDTLNDVLKTLENNSPQSKDLREAIEKYLRDANVINLGSANDNNSSIPLNEALDEKGPIQKFLKFLGEQIHYYTKFITDDPLIQAAGKIIVKAFKLVKTVIEGAINNAIAIGEFAGALLDFGKAAGDKVKCAVDIGKKTIVTGAEWANYCIKKIDAVVHKVTGTAKSYVKLIQGEKHTTSKASTHKNK